MLLETVLFRDSTKAANCSLVMLMLYSTSRPGYQVNRFAEIKALNLRKSRYIIANRLSTTASRRQRTVPPKRTADGVPIAFSDRDSTLPLEYPQILHRDLADVRDHRGVQPLISLSLGHHQARAGRVQRQSSFFIEPVHGQMRDDSRRVHHVVVSALFQRSIDANLVLCCVLGFNHLQLMLKFRHVWKASLALVHVALEREEHHGVDGGRQMQQFHVRETIHLEQLYQHRSAVLVSRSTKAWETVVQIYEPAHNLFDRE